MTVPPAEPPGQRSAGRDAGDRGGSADRQSAQRDRRRRVERRRLDEIFGDVLPATTDDEREPGERAGFDAEYYRYNRPPHHDR